MNSLAEEIIRDVHRVMNHENNLAETITEKEEKEGLAGEEGWQEAVEHCREIIRKYWVIDNHNRSDTCIEGNWTTSNIITLWALNALISSLSYSMSSDKIEKLKLRGKSYGYLYMLNLFQEMAEED